MAKSARSDQRVSSALLKEQGLLVLRGVTMEAVVIYEKATPSTR